MATKADKKRIAKLKSQVNKVIIRTKDDHVVNALAHVRASLNEVESYLNSK